MAREVSAASTTRRWLIVGAVLAVLLCGVAWSRTRAKIADDPRAIYLSPMHGARWIRVGRPSNLGANGRTELIHEFRTRLTLRGPVKDPLLTFHALTEAAVYLDDLVVYSSSEQAQKWKEPQTFTLAPELRAGPHELRFAVRNRNGAVALIAWCDAIGLSTDEDWEVREGFTADWKMKKVENKPWSRAALVETVFPTALSNEFPTTSQAFVSCLPLIAPLFFAVAIGGWMLGRSGGTQSRWRRFAGSPGTWRWALMAACAVLWINNIFKVPLYVGFDVDAHVEYIQYVAENWSIPYAGDGWQMFQSPLYYIVSALLVRAFGPFVEHDSLLRLLRIVPAACGLAQIEICYRALKLVFPNREDTQRLGLLVGGLMPMNLYISNYVGNETMAGCLSALVVLLTLQAVVNPLAAKSKRWQLFLGLALGFALLSKVTAVLLLLPVLAAVSVASWNAEKSFARRSLVLIDVFGIAALVAGWYYLRNWIKFGVPFLGGWDVDRGIVWWQDPGYRTLRDFVSFSQALIQPVNSACYGFWDGLYSTLWLDGHLSSMDKLAECPPWNDSLLLTAPWLAILPTAAILLGGSASLWHPSRTIRGVLLFCGCCLAIYLAAMLQLMLVVPTYSTVKATYTLGIIPCYAILAAAGLQSLWRNRVLLALAYGWIAAFGAVAYLTYFVFPAGF